MRTLAPRPAVASRKRPAPARAAAVLAPAPVRLPSGVRDYLPRAARRRRGLAEALVGVFERWGYRRIITPAFEYEEVLARGLGAGARTGAIRFVEPLSGEVAMLRPDLTPQVARLVATRLRDADGPLRLCYEGSVLRSAPGPHGQRELIQAGVELFGVPAPAGDLEIVALAAAALAALDVGAFTLDLGLPGLARGALGQLGLPPGPHDALLVAVARKDQAMVRELCAGARGAPAAARALCAALPGLYGGPEVLGRARRLCRAPAARAALTTLEAAVAGLAALGLAESVSIDLGEVRGFDYYTGLRFAAYVDGLGDAILAGGRYDGLCGRYGRPLPATGFAIDVEAAAATQRARGTPPPPLTAAILVVGQPRPAAAAAAALRRAGRTAATHPPASPAVLRQYAERWEFTTIIELARLGARERAALGRGEVPEVRSG
ncbi:MAG TPA: ATP phosphoribosyltransferase regulatory subunit [Polyangia bacterium]|jgi:ATP phosphoribosyltransferase regulatory subunit